MVAEVDSRIYCCQTHPKVSSDILFSTFSKNMSSNMARTLIASRNTQNPTYSDGYEGHQSRELIDCILGGEESFRSPVDLTSRTPTHIRFEDDKTEPNQLAILPVANSQIAEKEAQLREALIVIKYLEEQIRHLQKPRETILDIPQQVGIIARQKGGGSISGNDSNGATAREESTRIGLPMLYSQHIDAAPLSSVMPEIENAPLVVTADRRVPISKYCRIVQFSMEIAKKHLVSHKDKSFDNLDMLDIALRASNLLSLVDGSRKRPTQSPDNTSGYVAEAIVHTVDSDGMPSYIIIAADDCYRYYHETIIAFMFMMSMVHKDMHHILLDLIQKEDPFKIYRAIQEHFKGGKNHHVAAATESTTTDRICFKFQTNKCTRKGCPYIHKLMTDQEKRDQRYSTKRPAVKENNNNNKYTKKINGKKKFKGKKDTRNNNSYGTNEMHNNMPLTREHQFMLGAGQGKPSVSNPNGYSKKQMIILNFLFEQEPIKNLYDNGNFSSWGGSAMNAYTVNKNDVHTKGMSFNMFSPVQESASSFNIMNDSSAMRCTRKYLNEIEERSKNATPVAVSSEAMNIFTISSGIGGSVYLPVLYDNVLLVECAKVNMLGWNNYPTNLVGGHHEGSDEIMVALYKLNEVIFDATVVYPFKIYNQEAQRYKYRKHAFMTFNPNHKNKYDKPYGESGFYRSYIENISQYFDKYENIRNEELMRESDRQLWLFAIYYDFMSHVAQQFERHREHSQSLVSARKILVAVVSLCYNQYSFKNKQMRNTMFAIIAESYPATHFVKDFKSDFQVMKSMAWNDFMTGENPANIKELRKLLLNNIEPNEYDPESRQLRRGENLIEGMISNKK